MIDNRQIYEQTRHYLQEWQEQLKANLLNESSDLMHSYLYYFSQQPEFIRQLRNFAHQVAFRLEEVVAENNLDANLPKVEHYDALGERVDRVKHHSFYITAGDIIYGSDLMHYLLKPGQMRYTLSLFLLSSHAGEAGHNCPIACSAGVIRVLKNYSTLADTETYLHKLVHPSFSENYTGAQFLTEIQGGSDVGANAAEAWQDEQGQWHIAGEKWFCSNANADLILMTARFDQNIKGTKGLGLFLVPARLADGQTNHYQLRRLKEKIGTRSMATGEIDFDGALAYPMGEPSQGINLVMENVLHLSRIFNAFSVLGMARRAYQIAYYYALNRPAFQQRIIDYPLVKENLAEIKAENTAMLASIFYMASCQDQLDLVPPAEQVKEEQLLLRIMANLNKYFTAKRSVENIHHCLDILAGNGTIESFSSLPRLLRDCIVCENWEGTHFTLWMQILRDIEKFQIDELFFAHLEELLSKLDKSYQSLLTETMDKLKQSLDCLKKLPLAEQSLKIRDIVEQMATLQAAITLALEVQDSKAPKTKKAALDLFMRKYINPHCYEGDYIALLDAVLAEA